MSRDGLLAALEREKFTFKDQLLLYVRTHKELESLSMLVEAYKNRLSTLYSSGRDDFNAQQEVLTTLRELHDLKASWRS